MEIENYSTVDYRDKWMEQWIGDDEGRLKAEQSVTNPSVHLQALKQAVDENKGRGDSHSLPLYAVLNMTDYMVEFLKGRGDFYSNFIAVLRAFEAVARQVG